MNCCPCWSRCKATGEGRGLVVIAPTISGDALNILVTNKTRGSMPTLGIKAPGLGPEKAEVLTDLAVLTGGRVFYAEADDRIERATLADLGQAREVQAIRSGFTLIGGKGPPAAIRQRTQELRSRLPKAPYGRDRNRLVERAGKLQGGVGLLEIGGSTEASATISRSAPKKQCMSCVWGCKAALWRAVARLIWPVCRLASSCHGSAFPGCRPDRLWSSDF